jgi:simple sugar transport system permease protein
VTAIRVPETWATGRWSGVLRWVVGIGAAVVAFGLIMAVKGVNPLTAYSDMLSSLTQPEAFGQILVKATPLILAALAVAIPARAGMVNVGGEGQLIIGGVASAGVVLWLADSLAAPVVMVLMIVAAMLAGGLWAGLAGVLRERFGINEAVTTLLMNYMALDLMYFLIYDRWKDRAGSGQPATAPLPVNLRLPLIGTSSVSVGFVIALVATVVVALALKRTTWGFRLRVVGGNIEAARRSGYRVGWLMLGAIAAGGALAGLGGYTQLAGAEFKLRPGFLVTYGYIGFLASWLGKHNPFAAAGAAIVLAALTVGGDSLQIDSGLPAASVNILMALVLLAVFGFSKRKAATS